MRASNSIARMLLAAVAAGGCAAQTLTVTVPAAGALMTVGWNLTAQVSAMPNVSRVCFFVDARLEDCSSANIGGYFYGQYHDEPWTDYYNEKVYAVAYDWLGNTIATSSTNTFRIDNHGLNAVSTFNQSLGAVAGPLVWTPGNDATSVTGNLGSYTMALDGMQVGWSTQGSSSWTATSSINTSTSTISIPYMPFHTGEQIFANCVKKNGSAQCASYPSGLYLLASVYAVVIDGNHLKLASSSANAATCKSGGTNCLSITSQGDSDGMVQFTAYYPWYAQGGGGAFSATINTRYFPNGAHRLDEVMPVSSPGSGISGTQTWPASAITAGTPGSINVANAPFYTGQSITLSSSGTSGIASPCSVVMLDSSDFYCNGQTISQGTGTYTASFTSSIGQSDPAMGTKIGTDTEIATFSNGSARMALWPQYQHVWVTPGETQTLTIDYMNCDGSVDTSVNATGFYYGSEDSTIATVAPVDATHFSISGTSSGATPPKETWINIIDDTNGYTAQVLVTLVADHNSFPHFSTGSHGILTSYTPGESIYLSTLFAEGPLYLFQRPYPGTNPANWFYWGGTSTIEGVQSLTYNGYGVSNYSTWLSAWTAPSSPQGVNNWNLASILTQISPNGTPVAGFGFHTGICGGYKSLYNTSWQQQAYSTELSAWVPYVSAVDECDETDSHFGQIAHTSPQMGSGNDGLNWKNACTPTTCGLQSVVVSGSNCATSYCTATVNMYTYGIVTNVPVYLWGDTTTPNLNGGYWISNAVTDTTDPLSYNAGTERRLVSFQIQVRDIPAGTYTDASLNVGTMWAGYFGSYNPKASYTWSTGPSSISVSGNTATFTWTAHPFPSSGYGYLGLKGFSSTAWEDPSGNAGIYKVNYISANSFSIQVAGVPAGTYSSSTDSGATFDIDYDPSSEVPQSVPYLMTQVWPTGSQSPHSFPQIEGGTLLDKISYGPFSNYNSIYASWSRYFRYGDFNYDNYVGGQTYGQNFDWPLGLTGPGFNYYVNGPFIFLTQINAQDCIMWQPEYVCHVNQGRDRDDGGIGVGNTFTEELFPVILGVGAGVRAYGGIDWFTKYSYFGFWSPTNPNNNWALYGGASDYTDVFPENTIAMAEVRNWIQRNLKYTLAPPASTPNYGPLVISGVRKIPSGGGTLHMVGSWSEATQSVTVNLSQFELGGPVGKEYVTPRGTVVTSLSPTASSDTCALSYATLCAYFFQPSGAIDDLTYTTFSFNPSQYGASKVALEVHYYPKDDALGVYDCTSGCTVPADLNGQNGLSPVWYRYTYLAANGSVLAQSDLQRFK